MQCLHIIESIQVTNKLLYDLLITSFIKSQQKQQFIAFLKETPKVQISCQ
jgi:hypothetical protein